mmetsp:Transcript_27965/g.39323  ORF Transcript_27965/g.39323 Transcript_27965/m.39323 type:complete len:123 (-) Transcript_27965:615-983(-)
MHKLMVEKGFERKSEEEIAKIAEDKEKDSDRKLEDAKKKMRERYTNLKQNQKKKKETLAPHAPLKGKDVEKMLFEGQSDRKKFLASEPQGLAGQILPLVSVSVVIGFVFFRRRRSKSGVYTK